MTKRNLGDDKSVKQEFIYCDTRNCPHQKCLRQYFNAPQNKLIRMARYPLEKNGKCMGLLEEKNEH